MNDLTSITTIVRSLINDEEQTTSDIFTYTTSDTFTLTEKNINDVTSVSINGTESGVTWTEDLTTSRISIDNSMTLDDVIEVNYTYYSNYSDTEIQAYIKSALVHLSVNNVKTFKVNSTSIYPEVLDEEANLIALIASILINPQNISYRMPDIAVSVPKDLPTLDKVKKVIAMYKKDGAGVFFLAEDLTKQNRHILP